MNIWTCINQLLHSPQKTRQQPPQKCLVTNDGKEGPTVALDFNQLFLPRNAKIDDTNDPWNGISRNGRCFSIFRRTLGGLREKTTPSTSTNKTIHWTTLGALSARRIMFDFYSEETGRFLGVFPVALWFPKKSGKPQIEILSKVL